MKFLFKNKKIQHALTLPWAFALLVSASAAVTEYMILLQPDFGSDIFSIPKRVLLLIGLLNWLPVLFLMLAAFFACGNIVVSCGLAGALCVLLSTANRLMASMRLAPLRPYDLLLGMEFLGIAKSLRVSVYILLFLGLAAFALCFIFLIKKVKNNKPAPLFRLAGLLVCAACAAALNARLYADEGVYEYLPVRGSVYNETAQYQSKGFAYCFLHTLNASRITRPEYYGEYRGFIEAAENAPVPAPGGAYPNIVLVLSEAFSEIPLNPHFNFDGYTDPLRFYKELKDSSASGSIVVPNIGGGTSDTEFDILTGINTRDFRGVPYAFDLVTRPFPGITETLIRAGYNALAVHPGKGWFYNRQNVYPLLGFGAFIDDGEFDAQDTKGMYITETQTMDKLIAEYGRHTESAAGAPLFLTCITIQNHGPYIGKYGAAALNFNTDLTFTEDETNALYNYFEGIADCDRELEKLVTFLRSVPEPVMLVYFGDHLPSMQPSLYEALIEPCGNDESEIIRYNRLPYIVWGNDAARPYADAFADGFSEEPVFSAHYLGAAIVRAAGLSGFDPFLDFLNELINEYPVALERTYLGADGAMRAFAPETDKRLALYKCWEYYRVRER